MVLELDGLLVLNMFFVLYSLQIHSIHAHLFLSLQQGAEESQQACSSPFGVPPHTEHPEPVKAS